MIDWSQIQQLEEDVGTEDLAEVVEIFIEEVDEAVDALRDITTMPDADLGPAMHFLKGSAANLGFTDFANYCSDAEKLANTGDGGQVDIGKVVLLYDTSKTQFFAEAANNCGLRMTG